MLLPLEVFQHVCVFFPQALVTVVVSLTSYGREFVGGLYVSTGSGEGGQEYYLALQAGASTFLQCSSDGMTLCDCLT